MIPESSLDVDVLAIIDKNPNMLVPWYLMSAYGYYVACHTLITDGLFDEMSKRMLAQWDEIDHPHKALISLSDVTAGTYLGEYPLRTISAYHRVVSDGIKFP